MASEGSTTWGPHGTTRAQANAGGLNMYPEPSKRRRAIPADIARREVDWFFADPICRDTLATTQAQRDRLVELIARAIERDREEA